jgi:L-threonylcarbamoyladenylate synthase
MIATRIVKTDNPRAITLAKDISQAGGLIAFPTDTIYGLAANAFNPAAIESIFAVKGRPDEKALPVLIGSFRQIEELVLQVDERLRRIAAAFWPGPLTLVLHKNPRLPAQLSPYSTVGVRKPNPPFTLNLLTQTGPLATTSANLSGGPNPIDATSVMAQLDGRINLLIDGGPTPGPTASTVVDISEPELKVLRPGPISLAEIEAVLSE